MTRKRAVGAPPPMVLVVWEDAKVVDDGATWAENKPVAYRPHVFHQVGFLVSDTAAGVILTAAWHPEMVAARDQIPRGMIRSMTVLGPA